jgi:hypothetical protein
MEFPTPESIEQRVPLPRTVIHFEIDEIFNRILGLGKNFGRNNYNSTTKTWNPQEAGWHRINFDVGIWTSDVAGGTTARMRAYQILSLLFLGTIAQQKLDEAADAGDGRIEITNFTGGRFITETINDVVTYRTIDGNLEVRVFSRTPLEPTFAAPTIEEIIQQPSLVIVE